MLWLIFDNVSSMGFPKESDIHRTANEEVSDIGITNALNNRCAHQQEYQPIVHLLWCAKIRKVDILAAVVGSCTKAVPSRFRSPDKSFAAARTDTCYSMQPEK
ncbi:hypothetical protein Tco_1231124 [Tanacetum coccineum]